MKWTVTTPAAETPVSYAQCKLQLRLDGDDLRDLILEDIEACTTHAENKMECSLVERTVTAVFYEGEPIHLPRGPVISITSITDDGGTAITDYDLERVGNSDRLKISVGFEYPLTVVYQAGYGTAAQVPADIRRAIKAHVVTMHQLAGTHTEKSLVPVPHLDDFYRLNAREVGIG